MGNQGPRIILNSAEAVCTNSIHRIYFKEDLSETMRKAIILSLWSTYGQISAEIEGRTYGSGVLKLEPSEASKLVVFLPKKLHHKSVGALWKKVGKLREQNLPICEQIDSWILEGNSKLKKIMPSKVAIKLLPSVFGFLVRFCLKSAHEFP